MPATAIAAQSKPIEVRRDVEYGVANGKRLLLDAYFPSGGGSGRRPAVVLIHGGSFRGGAKWWFEPEARKLAAKGWVAFSVDYRLDEPAAFPAEVDDVQNAVRWIRAHADEYKVDPKRIGALGESAGGHLAAMVAMLGKGDRTVDARIEVAVAWSGLMDLADMVRERGDGWGVPIMGCSLAACPDKFAQFSPITHVDGTDPPLSLVTSTNELVPLGQTEAMASRIEDENGTTQVQRLDGTKHALEYRDDGVWNPTLLFLETYLDPPPPTSAGTVVFALTLVVIVAGVAVGTAMTRRRRRTTVTV